MFRKISRSKIHPTTVTHVDLHYEGSITVQAQYALLLRLSDFLPNSWQLNQYYPPWSQTYHRRSHSQRFPLG